MFRMALLYRWYVRFYIYFKLHRHTHMLIFLLIHGQFFLFLFFFSLLLFLLFHMFIFFHVVAAAATTAAAGNILSTFSFCIFVFVAIENIHFIGFNYFLVYIFFATLLFTAVCACLACCYRAAVGIYSGFLNRCHLFSARMEKYFAAHIIISNVQTLFCYV